MKPGATDDVRDRVRRFIVDTFYVRDAADVANGASLIASGLIDSTGVLELVTFLESEFGIVVAQHEMTPDNLETIERIAIFVAAKKSSGVRSAA
ncbi:MAG TPA: acyl carrier protein [Burkholderiales bacterium]